MIRFTWQRMLRQPLPILGVLTFAAILVVTLCTLHQSSREVRDHYEEIYHQIDVNCTITNLTGTASQELDISNIILNDFTGYLAPKSTSMAAYLENIQVRSTQHFAFNSKDYTLTAITSPAIAPELWPDNGCSIEWLEGYGESIFSGSEFVCVIPEELFKKLEEPVIRLSLTSNQNKSYLNVATKDFDGELTVAGVAYGIEENMIYCPWNTLMDIWAYMGQLEDATALHGTLKNNDDLENFRALAAESYPVPDPNADPASWDLALDIDDSQLKQAELTLRNSLRVNDLSRMLVFALTAGAGFLIGFLMIRSRKREIALLRTLGTANFQVYISFSLEQSLCAVLGALIGGAGYRWEPVWQLGVFVGVYFLGLSLALILFLRTNLLVNLKEGE